MEEIKMVIWDMDYTFWNGTISEKDICPNTNTIYI